MLTFLIRPMRVPEDCAYVAHITNAYRGGDLTAEGVVEMVRDLPPEGIQYRLVAEDQAGRLIGHAFAYRLPHHTPGRFIVRVQTTEPEFRGCGVGTGLCQAIDRFAREQGAAFLDGEVRDNDPAGLEWAQHRGFGILDHVFESVLDLARFDPAPFAGAMDATGLRFARLTEFPPEEGLRQLYALEKATAPDNPAYDSPEFVAFHTWQKELPRPEHILVALDGDRFAGVTMIEPNPAGTSFYTHYTGVRREYRGRGVALALKLLGIDLAREAGAVSMRTNNDSTNAPMLAVNRKLGYTPIPGWYGLRKLLT